MAAPELLDGIKYGFLDNTVLSEERYKPALLINDYEQGEKVLTSIVSELKNCDEFFFSVAFITESGVTVLLQELLNLQKRGIRGKIIASQYQNFTQPKALRKLLKFDNIELRIVTDDKNMHTKGYIFRHGNEYTSIIGSSNMTQNALCENKEWNMKVISTKDGGITLDALKEFNKLFEIATPVDEEFLKAYELIYSKKQELYRLTDQQYKENVIDVNEKVYPNLMQVTALQNLDDLRKEGQKRALLISATGTGKTYLSAFDVNAFDAKKFLFVIHREQIAKAALKSFKRVVGNDVSMAIFSGNAKDYDADYLFATIQSLSKDDVLSKFAPDAFDYVVIDEAHRSGAATYQKVINYFKPKFLLGMTATPERTDGYDIYSLFDHNIAYEIRLQDAMKEKLICPFHYFGISDIEVDGKPIDDSADFNNLTSDERVRHIIEQANIYGFSGDRVKGLIFCSQNEICKQLSEKFNALGYRTVALSGSNSQDERADAVKRLEQDEYDGGLDYIFTVDIFNEGVDIPAINQVIMLRPTASAIIFVQQLGRGLRHYTDKDYLTVIDFIGNYDKNFLIPIALSGDRTYNKDTVRRYVAEGNCVIPGCSTVNFDEITAKRIYESIDAANFNDVRLIKESYKQLKYKLGKIPSLMDFEIYGEIDPIRIFDNKSLGSYYTFLKKYEPEYEVSLSSKEEEFIKFVSIKLANGKRPHELILLSKALQNLDSTSLVCDTEQALESDYMINITPYTRTNLVNVLTCNFASGSAKDTFKNCVFIEPAGSDYKLSTSFKELLKNKNFFDTLKEVVDFGLYKNRKYYPENYKGTPFQLYAKYSYEDVCRLLEWEKNEVSLNIGGYKYDRVTHTYPVYINYDKNEDIQDTIKYEDHFTSQTNLIAISKSNRSVDSDDVQNALHANERGITMHLFVRKNKDDRISKEFYYLGVMHATGYTKEFVMPNTTSSAVEIGYKLETPVRRDLYEYIVE